MGKFFEDIKYIILIVKLKLDGIFMYKCNVMILMNLVVVKKNVFINIVIYEWVFFV